MKTSPLKFNMIHAPLTIARRWRYKIRVLAWHIYNMFLSPAILCKWTSIAIELNVGRSLCFWNISACETIEIFGWSNLIHDGFWPLVIMKMFRIQGAYISIERIEYFNWLKSKIWNMNFVNCTILVNTVTSTTQIPMGLLKVVYVCWLFIFRTKMVIVNLET